MSLLFKRPENLMFPKIYYTFKAKDVDCEILVEYRVQDLPETYFKEALSLLSEHFLSCEELCASHDCWNDVVDVLTHINNQINPFEIFNVDQYFTAYGLVVNSKYRGREIVTEMLKARIPIIKAFGLKVTVTIFTGIGSQTAAKKADYDDLYSFKYIKF
ncbi:hypothetical protein PVAND_015903 [Polypedilum vanderplanki]|uniref:Uncharacterized protein n=1 Tax=Polypedilum vanderplanki TaxID=319348 RepID=A0A9J6BE03_POLVA|nr:hypothetical protein PVAND_015903 [Polypedilum vanderplanki]